MARIRTLLSSSKVTVALFVLAVLLLLGGAIGATRAALTYFSETYRSQVEMFDIGVSLLENGKIVSYRDYDEDSQKKVKLSEKTGVLLADMVPEGENFQLGRKYPEVLSVKNSGDIDQYVRVTIRKFWLNPDGSNNRELSPDLIGLNLTNVVDRSAVDSYIAQNPTADVWIKDTESSTTEREVLYYRNILPVDATSLPFTDTLIIDGSLVDKVNQTVKETSNGKIITTTYVYDGMQLRVEADVDAVQTHSDKHAIRSAWGIDPALLHLQETETE